MAYHPFKIQYNPGIVRAPQMEIFVEKQVQESKHMDLGVGALDLECTFVYQPGLG